MQKLRHPTVPKLTHPVGSLTAQHATKTTTMPTLQSKIRLYGKRPAWVKTMNMLSAGGDLAAARMLINSIKGIIPGRFTRSPHVLVLRGRREIFGNRKFWQICTTTTRTVWLLICFCGMVRHVATCTSDACSGQCRRMRTIMRCS
jgi:hypothetical protein